MTDHHRGRCPSWPPLSPTTSEWSAATWARSGSRLLKLMQSTRWPCWSSQLVGFIMCQGCSNGCRWAVVSECGRYPTYWYRAYTKRRILYHTYSYRSPDCLAEFVARWSRRPLTAWHGCHAPELHRSYNIQHNYTTSYSILILMYILFFIIELIVGGGCLCCPTCILHRIVSSLWSSPLAYNDMHSFYNNQPHIMLM